MKRLMALFAVGTVGLGISMGSHAANECRLKYKYGNSGNQYQWVNQGANLNLSRNNVGELSNVGTNDMRVTLEYKDLLGNTRFEDITLIRSGSLTIALPPTPLIGKHLRKIYCGNHATVTDTQTYINQFGNSAINIVNNARTTATTNVTNFVNSQVNQFTQQQGLNWRTTSQQAIDDVEAAFANAQAAATQTVANLQNDFPEVNDAINSTNNFSWNLSGSVIEQTQTNINDIWSELRRLDNKYQVSQTAGNLVSVNLSSDFPEIQNLVAHRCEFSPAYINSFDQRLQNLRREFARLDSKYRFSERGQNIQKALIHLSQQQMAAFNKLGSLKPCQVDLMSVVNAAEKDFVNFQRYVGNVANELSKLQAVQFKGSQAEFFRQAQNLLQSTEALLRELEAQRQRKARMEEADKAHQKAFEKVRNDIGPMHDFFEDKFGGDIVIAIGVMIKEQLPTWLTRDHERLKKNLEDEQRAAQAYHDAIVEYDRGMAMVGQRYGRWTQAINATVVSATQTRITIPDATKLIASLKRVPKFEAGNRAIESAIKCHQQFLNTLAQGAAVAGEILKQYQSAANTVTNQVLPDDVRNALHEYSQATLALANAVDWDETANTVGQSFQNSQRLVDSLTPLFNGDVTEANFQQRIQRILDGITTQASNELSRNIGNANNQFGRLQRQFGAWVSAREEFMRVSARHRNDAFRDTLKVADAALDLSGVWEEIGTHWSELRQCAADIQSKTANATQQFPSRLMAFINNKVQVVANALPPAIKTALTNTKNEADQLNRRYNQFLQAVTEANTAWNEFIAAKNIAVGSFQPLPTQNTTNLLHAAVDKFDAFDSKMQTVNSRWNSAMQKQGQFVTSLNSLKNSMGSVLGEGAADVVGLTYPAFNHNLVAQQLSQTGSLANKWELAKNTLPERLAAFLSGGLSPQVVSAVEQGLQQMQQKHQQIQSCLSNSTTARQFIGSNQRRNQAINNTVNGLQNDAQDVIDSLASLLPPSFNILNQVNGVLIEAGELADRIGNIGSTARNNIQNLVQSGINDLAAAKTCVLNNRNFNTDMRDDLLQDLNQNSSTPTMRRRISR